MSAIAVFLDLKIYNVILFLLLFGPIGIDPAERVNWYDGDAMKHMVKISADIYKSTFTLMEGIEYIKQKNFNKPSFEVGYLMFTTFEVYRKMIDKYNTSHMMNRQLFFPELVIYLEEIENHYWELDHLTVQNIKDFKRVFNDSIYNELSWSVKLILIKDYLDAAAKNVTTTTTTEMPAEAERRMPRMEALVAGRRQEADVAAKVTNEDDNSMRLKLFRLMYETIRDSDLKCKRAELIRSHYENSSTFEIGYLMGDVMDKYNIMSDISMTLNRLFHEWKPIEHINAYEQISNQAIEINHLIDMMKGISRQANSSSNN